MIEAGIAQLFLQHSLDLPQVAASTTTLIDSIGLPRLHQTIVQESRETQMISFKRLCAAASIDLPSEPDRARITIGKFQKLKATHNKSNPHQLALDLYQDRKSVV